MVLNANELHDLNLNSKLLYNSLKSESTVHIGHSNYYVSQIVQTPMGSAFVLKKRGPVYKSTKYKQQKGNKRR